jgi:hypothetical protein
MKEPTKCVLITGTIPLLSFAPPMSAYAEPSNDAASNNATDGIGMPASSSEWRHQEGLIRYKVLGDRKRQ